MQKLQAEEQKIVLDRLISSVDDDWEKFFNRVRRRFERLVFAAYLIIIIIANSLLISFIFYLTLLLRTWMRPVMVR